MILSASRLPLTRSRARRTVADAPAPSGEGREVGVPHRRLADAARVDREAALLKGARLAQAEGGLGLERGTQVEVSQPDRPLARAPRREAHGPPPRVVSSAEVCGVPHKKVMPLNEWVLAPLGAGAARALLGCCCPQRAAQSHPPSRRREPRACRVRGRGPSPPFIRRSSPAAALLLCVIARRCAGGAMANVFSALLPLGIIIGALSAAGIGLHGSTLLTTGHVRSTPTRSRARTRVRRAPPPECQCRSARAWCPAPTAHLAR
eukprot:982242-Prymnesium_polylepis.2